MDKYTYTKYSDTEFQWSDNPALQTSIVFFLAYDYEDDEMPGTLIKHGSKEYINKYLKKNLTKYQELEKHEAFARTQHIVVPVTKIALENLDEVNKCLGITGYIGKFLKKFDLLPDEFDDFEIIDSEDGVRN